MEETTLNIDLIVCDMSVNPRFDLDMMTIDRYAGIIGEMPPLDIFDVADEGYLLAAGFHRYEAHKLKEHGFVSCIIHKGNRQDVIDFADRSNAKNPLQLKSEELIEVCKRVLANDRAIPDSILRRDYGIPQKMIDDIKKLIAWESDSLLPVNGNYGKLVPQLSPRQKERHWSVLHFSESRTRKPTTLLERLQRCEMCRWPFSVRAHILDVAAWGENPFTKALCVRCHEVYDMMVKVSESQVDKPKRAELLLEKLESELPKDLTEWYGEMKAWANNMVIFRDKAYQEWQISRQNLLEHYETAPDWLEKAKGRGIT